MLEAHEQAIRFAYFASERRRRENRKTGRGVRWCRETVGGMRDWLREQADSVPINGADGVASARKDLFRYCRACGLCDRKDAPD